MSFIGIVGGMLRTVGSFRRALIAELDGLSMVSTVIPTARSAILWAADSSPGAPGPSKGSRVARREGARRMTIFWLNRSGILSSLGVQCGSVCAPEARGRRVCPCKCRQRAGEGGIKPRVKAAPTGRYTSGKDQRAVTDPLLLTGTQQHEGRRGFWMAWWISIPDLRAFGEDGRGESLFRHGARSTSCGVTSALPVEIELNLGLPSRASWSLSRGDSPTKRLGQRLERRGGRLHRCFVGRRDSCRETWGTCVFQHAIMVVNFLTPSSIIL
jgi:hypothetical protein